MNDHRSSDEVVNLTFHGIGKPARAFDPGESEYWITPRTFISILDAVRTRDDVALSFDDGNISDIALALPELVDRGLSAIFFVIVNEIGRPEFLDESAIGALVAAGMQIGVHGLSHRPWTTLQTPELDLELATARRRIEEITGQPVAHASCPFGEYDRRVLLRLRAAGFGRVFTSDCGTARRNAWLQPRNSIRVGENATVVDRLFMERAQLGPRTVRTCKLLLKRWR